MKASQRRQQIIDILTRATQPISASQLAKQLEVSRQIIVGDVALLRASNHDILSTPKGYLLSQALYSHQYIGKIACQHGPDDTEREMVLIVENGGNLLDVEVEHPVYGILTASLAIKNLEDVSNFMQKLATSKANLLSSLTKGIHLHTISCPSQAIFEQIKETLAREKLLLEED